MARYKLTFWDGAALPDVEYSSKSTVGKDHHYYDENKASFGLKRRHKTLAALKKSSLKILQDQIDELEELKTFIEGLDNKVLKSKDVDKKKWEI